jgi:hypothetical protein
VENHDFTTTSKQRIPLLAGPHNKAGSGSTSNALGKRHCVNAFPLSKKKPLDLSDAETKLKILGTPKGGATVSTQIMFRKLGLLEEALEYDSWIHNYRTKVFRKRNERVRCKGHCGNGWNCVKLVRSPLDRVVSSFIHVLKSSLKDKFRSLQRTVQHAGKESLEEASFADFIQAASLAAKTKESFPGDGHYTPQSANDECDDLSYLLPVESIEDGLSALYDVSGVLLNATGLTSKHYIVKDSTLGSSNQDIQDVSKMSFKLLMNNTDSDGRHHTASYDAYLRDPSLNEEICRLFCHDFALYAKACSSPLLSGRQKTQYVCNQERLRVLSVCGPGYDFFV